jgi:hypothetical protein
MFHNNKIILYFKIEQISLIRKGQIYLFWSKLVFFIINVILFVFPFIFLTKLRDIFINVSQIYFPLVFGFLYYLNLNIFMPNRALDYIKYLAINFSKKEIYLIYLLRLFLNVNNILVITIYLIIANLFYTLKELLVLNSIFLFFFSYSIFIKLTSLYFQIRSVFLFKLFQILSVVFLSIIIYLIAYINNNPVFNSYSMFITSVILIALLVLKPGLSSFWKNILSL